MLGHHSQGWGHAYLSEDDKQLIVKRDITPIYRADWKNISKIKTRFLLVHARKSLPKNKTIEDVHPINIREKYLMVHNGTISRDSFPRTLEDSRLEEISNNTEMDTRKYLCLLMDELKDSNSDLKMAVESTFRKIRSGGTANAFLFNLHECAIIKRQKDSLRGRHATLFLTKEKNSILVCTTPISRPAKEIPDKSLIQVDLSDLSMKYSKLEI
jgi:predicted glutamine amidotransferase